MLLLLVVAGCGQAPPQSQQVQESRFGAGTTSDAPASNGKRLAVSHRFRLLIPNDEIENQQQKHLAECARLGCTVVNTTINRSDRGATGGSASVQLKPEAYERFVAVLAAPPAKVIFHSQTAIDLTAPFVDTEKRLAAKTRLRDRLTDLLNAQDDKTAADLVMIEKELSQVQGELEAMTAQLEALRNRTDTVSIDITYSGTSGGPGDLDLAPVREAVIGIGPTLIRSLAWLVYGLAAVAPWLPVIALVWWLIRRSMRRRRARVASE